MTRTLAPDREPLFDFHPQTGVTIEVFHADRTMETFGRCSAGWFWCARRRGFAPDGPTTGPFPTSYAAHRHAMNGAASDFEEGYGHAFCAVRSAETRPRLQ